MNNLSEFLHMGGYGAYVWSAYGITFVAMILAVVVPLRQHSSLRQRLTKQFKRKQQS